MTPEAPARLDDLESARKYIDAMDFEAIRAKLASPDGPGWSRGKAAAVEHQYKNWLYLRRKYEGRTLPPSQAIDEFWHAHILDTRRYHRDTAAIFGGYLHHAPYYGPREGADADHLQAAFAETVRLYREQFGEDLFDYDALWQYPIVEAADAQHDPS